MIIMAGSSRYIPAILCLTYTTFSIDLFLLQFQEIGTATAENGNYMGND